MAGGGDLTSVVFLEAWRKRRDVRLAGESVLPWLLAVANNAAAALGVPTGTLRSRLARARQRLRERAAQAAPIVTAATTSQEDQP